MLFKDALKDALEEQGMSVRAVSKTTGVPDGDIKAYLEGVPPKYQREQKLCEALGIDPDSITSDDLCMSVNECAALLGKSAGWVKNAIEQGTLPGSYTKTSTGHRDFHIPRLRIAEYLGLIGSSNIRIPHEMIVEVCRETAATAFGIMSSKGRR